MGGDIRLESEIGAGSEFTLTLPSVLGHLEPAPGERLPVLVFLASSEAVAVDVTAELARQVRVLATTEPARVAAVARLEDPDAIVLEAGAPNFGTWRAITALQADPGTAVLPVVLIARNGDSRDAAELGQLCIMSKPVAIERIVMRILSMLPEGSGEPILIADEDPDVRLILEEALRGAGHEASVAQDCTEAWQLLQTRRFGAAVIDLLLPGDDNGVVLMAKMRRDPGLRGIPVCGLIGKELSAEEMDQLGRAIERYTLSGEPPVGRIAEILLQTSAGPLQDATS
jgi:CheY-like chemotaxis protein